MNADCTVAQCYYNMYGRCAITEVRRTEKGMSPYPNFCPHRKGEEKNGGE